MFKKLTSGLNKIEYEEWSEFQREIFLVIDIKYKKKFSFLSNKLKMLLPKKNGPQKLVNIVEKSFISILYAKRNDHFKQRS